MNGEKPDDELGVKCMKYKTIGTSSAQLPLAYYKEPFKQLLLVFIRLHADNNDSSLSQNGRLLTGKAFCLSHVSSGINMALEKIWTLMNPPGILRDVK